MTIIATVVWRPLIIITMVTDFYGQHCDCKAIV